MQRAPRKHAAADALYAAALRALTRRAYSVYEMKQWLAQRAETRGLIQDVLARLKERGYVDDARYARQFARTRAESRRQGRFRIVRDLRARGVPDRHIAAALDELFAETDEAALLRRRLARKLRSLRSKPADAVGADLGVRPAADRESRLDRKQLASIYASLLRAGFPADLIRRELRALSKHADVPLEEEAPDTAEGHR